MADREKAIKGLECCRNGFCFACPYNDGIDENTDCKQRWADDTLALLKAQEPMEPTEPDEDNTQYCGACGSAVGYEVLEQSGMDYIRYNYCPECGQAVKWDG